MRGWGGDMHMGVDRLWMSVRDPESV